MNTPTNEVKAKLFGLYLGQVIVKVKISEFDDTTCVNPWAITKAIAGTESSYLELRDIASLTDDEAVQCAKIGFHFFECTGFKVKVIRELDRISVAAVSDDEKTCLAKIQQNDEWKLNIAQIDYLRSIGIALPFTYLDEQGHPQTASVPDQINWGWVRIKK